MYRHKSIAHHSMRVSHWMVANNLFKTSSEHRAIVLLLQVNMRHFAMRLEVVWLSRFDLVEKVYSIVDIAFLKS